MRIDYLLVTKSLAAKTTETAIDRNARKGEKPSDHAPANSASKQFRGLSCAPSAHDT
jgi:exonuclease III